MSTEKKRKILAVLVDRANFGRMRTVMTAIQEHPDLELQVLCAGSMVLERFGSTWQEVEEEGFTVNSRVYMELEGSVPLSMAKSLGFGIIEFSSELDRLRPDIVLLIGDRYEALGAALAAAYMNIPTAHIQGGEISGSIDDSARHAITKFAQWHFPSTKRSAEYIRCMGEPREHIFMCGCPVGDYILKLDETLPTDAFRAGSGAHIDVERDFLLVIFHPITTAFGTEDEGQISSLLDALGELRKPTVFLWPNIDAGADHISKSLRVFRDRYAPDWLRFLTNLPPVLYQKVLKRCRVAVGNSSSFVRDTTFSGTPVVLTGDRQSGRELGHNALCVPTDRAAIVDAIRQQWHHGRYAPDELYGDGRAGERIAEVLAKVSPYVQKRLDYLERGESS